MNYFLPGSGGTQPTVTFKKGVKGVKFDAVMVDILKNNNVEHVKIGEEDNVLIVEPCPEKDRYAFKVVYYRQKAGHVRSASLHEWALRRGLHTQRINGIWKDGKFTFSLEEALKQGN